ncbi:alkaline phosphatase family protein [uncultured Paraglaciecola sp.]|uniref:alkaline phosphatase family protein n=1 Tax=uncultured Paraglaciecola sp. TaxID=1765024 RepID=UPI0030D71B27|tara:strand:+ start:34203 stop:35336 length:1134 start_codon:yes stop_codon:yes gene_type:complete
MKQLSFYLMLCLASFSHSLLAADNLLLVSIDGLRWQEVFRGYQDDVLNLEDFKADKSAIQKQFFGDTPQEKRQKLLPFLWQVISKQGILIGNRDNQSSMQLTNDLWFSYPGYNELLTGKADPNIDSNHASDNLNITFLEWLNTQPGFKNQVAAFGSWDVFPAIINRTRSQIPINAGFESAAWDHLSAKAKWLNELQQQIPSPWHNVRLDAFTAGFAQEYILAKQPKVIYLALGETDDFAHQGNYPEYLRGAKRADQFIANIWGLLQSMEQYRGKTNLVITVDHGRGNSAKTWQHHGSAKAVKGYLNGLNQYKDGIPGADQVWLAALGPDVKQVLKSSDQKTDFTLNQVAATAIQLLNLNHRQFSPDIGQPLPIVKQR